MKYQLFISVFFLLTVYMTGQTFTGTSLDKAKAYRCSFKVNSDSSVIFIYHTSENKMYAQHIGSLEKINDSIFHVSAVMIIGKFDQMRQYTENLITHVINDTDYFAINPEIEAKIAPVIIKYANGKSENYSSKIQAIIPLNKKYFNKNRSCNYYYIQTGTKDLIGNAPLSFRVSFGSSPVFEKGDRIEFDVVIKGKVLYSIDAFKIQSGQFRLTKINSMLK